ncbi:putative uncharacterized protein DDB_G0291608 [Ruditapes philippinarum]|uniref:putative uncharacterized protein DDB_G0291608 n=1 Tax=Ruditapes philippinarum TaxID=129788 RepID=UPI00295BB799|nr:putative uncharacterized protein DDB_G0291608 [Ruditapes philippinarum]
MLNNQNQPTPGPLSHNYQQQQQQQLLNNQNQPTPRPLSQNYQQQQQLLNNQNQPTPGPLSQNYQQQQQLLNNQNQPTPGPLSQNYQQQQQLLNNQNQPTPGPLSQNYQQKQQLLNNQNQPTPGPFSQNYQQQQQLLNNQNQPTPGPLSQNYQQQQQLLNNQNQPTPGPLSQNYQQKQQLLNNQNQPTPRPLSQNYQQQQQILSNQNQPTPGPLSANYQQQQQLFNNQNQPIPGPLSPNYQQQQQMLNNQNQPTPRPLSPNYQQQQMLNNQNQPTPGPLSLNYQQQQQLLNNQNLPTPGPFPPNYQQKQQILSNQNQPTPRPLSSNYQQQQQLLNNQNQPTHRPLSSNYQQQQQLLNNQNQATHMNRPKLQQQFLQNKQHHQQQLNPTQGRNSQSNKSQLSPSKQNQNPNTKHAQQRTNQKSMLSQSQTILSHQNMQQPHRQTFSSHTVQTPLPQIPTLASASKPVKSNAVRGIPLSIDGPGLSAFNHVPSTKRQPQAKGTLKKTPTPFPSRKVNSRKNGQRRRIPHERYIMYRSTTTSSPRHSERRRQRNHGKRISRPSKEVTTVPSTNNFPKRPLKPMRLWNSSPNTSAGNPVWRQPLEQIQRTQSSHPTPIVPSPPNTPSTRGSVNGGSYIKNWFHPRKFGNSHGNPHESVQTSYSETGNSIKSQTKNNKQTGSVGRQRTRSEQIISQQTRNGRRPGIRLLSKDTQQSKDLPKRKKQPYMNNGHYSFKTTAKPSITPTSALPAQKSMGSAANLHNNAWNKPNSATTVPPIYSTGNTWNQYPEKERLFSATADAFKLAPGTVNLSLNAHLNKSNVQNNVSNQSTVSDVKKNKTISITQHIKTSNNASQGRHNHAHAPINFNVFLEVKPTPKPQQNSSQAAEMLKLLEALQILRGTMSPPTTMHPPVKFVFQMEPNVQQPAKLMCKCFKKSDGCPAELKEEHLMDMCYDNDTIPCCDDG